MKKTILSLSVATSALIMVPAHSGFVILQKPQAAPAPAPSTNSSYSLVESDSETSIIPVPRPAEPLYARPIAQPIQPRRAAQQETQPLLNVERLEAESERIHTQIEQLRADLEGVKAALASARARKGGNAQPINSRLDAIEQRIAVTSTSMMKIGFSLNSVRFAPDFAIAQQLLKSARAAAKVTIYGHADNTGTPERNADVAMSRAISARNYLQAQGIPVGRIATVSRGSSEPIADNSTAEGRAANRRVEIELNSNPALVADKGR
jgi:outer membrane protein OmpA-like peptidoglycan-associated protein